MQKIFIEVRGGVVDAVYTDTQGEQVQVVLIDWDNIESGDEEPEQPELNARFYLY